MVSLQINSNVKENDEETFARIINSAKPAKGNLDSALKASWIDTKLGPMVAIADEKFLYLLEFVERHHLERKVTQLIKKTNSIIISGLTPPLRSITKELNQYFEGKLKQFKTPTMFIGSTFQQRVWEELSKIPYGTTKSYAEIARQIGNPLAFRAVAQANGQNQLTIIVPCHRVINSNGALGGYAAGLSRKEWLLHHEK